MITTWKTLQPSGAAVTYCNARIDYPEVQVPSTLGQLFAPSLYALDLSALELGSDGKISLTLASQHSLDIERLSGGEVRIAPPSADAEVRLGGDAAFFSAAAGDASVSAASSLGLTAGGPLALSASGGARHWVPSPSAHTFAVGAKDVLVVSDAAVEVRGTLTAEHLVAPTADPASGYEHITGSIVYNAGNARFEGAAPGGLWRPLGGVVDTDQDTFIEAELGPGIDDDNLSFNTAGHERLRVTSAGWVGVGTADPRALLHVQGGHAAVSGSLHAQSVYSSRSRGCTDQLTPKTVVLGGSHPGTIGGEWTAELATDGVSNDGCGLIVAGVPAGVGASAPPALRQRLAKSVRWRGGAQSHALLGGAAAGGLRESAWELAGGSLRLCHVNPASGGRVRVGLRVNARDQLEVVRTRRAGASVVDTTETIAVLGGAADRPVASDVGFAEPVETLTYLQSASGSQTVFASLDVFSMTHRVRALAALYRSSDPLPTSQQVAAAAAAFGATRAGIAPGSPTRFSAALRKYHDGLDVQPGDVPFIATVCRSDDTGALSHEPFVTLVAARAEVLGFPNPEALLQLPVRVDTPAPPPAGQPQADLRAWLSSQMRQLLSADLSLRDLVVELGPWAGGSLLASVSVRVGLLGSSRLVACLRRGEMQAFALTAPETSCFVFGLGTAQISPTGGAPAEFPAVTVANRQVPVPAFDPLRPALVLGPSGLPAAYVLPLGAVDAGLITTVHLLVTDQPAEPSISQVVSAGASMPLAEAADYRVAVEPGASSYTYMVLEDVYGALSDVQLVSFAAPSVTLPAGTSLAEDGAVVGLVSGDLQTAPLSVQTTDGPITASLLLYLASDPSAPADAEQAYLALQSGATAQVVVVSPQ